jgi:hypothetical protein
MTRQRLSALLALCFAFALTACGQPTDEPSDEPETMTKDEARALGGKSDHADWCDVFHWYGDGICDDFCPQPDPDCAVDACATDADCPDGYCEHFATCTAIGCPPPPPSECVPADCDDGSSLNPLCDIREVCAEGQVSAVINGCFHCVDARTCEAPQPETCDDGSTIHPLCDIREVCPDGQTSAIQNGCFVCVDPDTCQAPDAGGQMCGGIAGLQCPDGYTCQMDVGMCQTADAAGTCVMQGDFCPAVYDPVCGCDGNTYSNSCYANAAGASIDHEGECLPPPETMAIAAGSPGCVARLTSSAPTTPTRCAERPTSSAPAPRDPRRASRSTIRSAAATATPTPTRASRQPPA